jgi:hypothetical protein
VALLRKKVLVALAVGLLFCLAGCGTRPTGIAGTVQAAGRDPIQVRIVELYLHTETNPQVYVEREAVFERTLSVDASGQATFEAQVHPGDYTVKLLSSDGTLLTDRKVAVKRNRMTRLDLDVQP